MYTLFLRKKSGHSSYTYKFKIYCGAEDDRDADLSLSENVVIELLKDLLDCNRTLYTDNFYTSCSLAKRLLARKTHLVGTLRKNRKYNPKIVQNTKLRKGTFNSFYLALFFKRYWHLVFLSFQER